MTIMKGLARPLAAALILMTALGATAATRKDLTLGDALKPGTFGGTLPRQVKWMPDGKAFCHFEAAPDGEASDLMAVDPETLRHRVLLSQSLFQEAYGKVTGVKGEALAKVAFLSYAFSPTGRYLQLDLPGGIFLWELKTSTLRRLTSADDEAAGFTFSPDESKVAFTVKGSLIVIDLATGNKTLLAEGRAPAVTYGEVDWLYGEELDLHRGFWWSPDGSKVAYLRFDETGVYQDPMVDESGNHPVVQPQFYPRPGDDLPKVSLFWIGVSGGQSHAVAGAESGEGYLPLAEWLPDSKGIAYALYNRAQDRLVLQCASLGGGPPKILLEEKWPTWINLPEGPRFLKDGRFLWMSERDGFAHLYLYGAEGKPPLQLTKGPWSVDSLLTVDEVQGQAYFLGNREAPLGCQVFRVDLGGKNLERVSPPTGWHAADFSPDARWYLDAHSAVSDPGTLSLVDARNGKARPVAESRPADLAEFGFVTPQFVEAKAADGQTLYAMVIKPRDFDPTKRYPVIVEVYGGPHAQVVQDRWSPRWMPLYQLWAQSGFVVFASDNRGSARRGKAFEDPLLRRLGRTELQDQLAALEVLKRMPFVDGARIGLWGWSYGGYMTLYALTHTDAYACGFAVAPVSDWLSYDACYTERYLKLPRDNEVGYRESSPVHAAEGLRGRLFFAHGLMDDNVHFANSAMMVDALLKAGKPFGTAYYPRMNHGIREKPARADLFARMLEFFQANLKP